MAVDFRAFLAVVPDSHNDADDLRVIRAAALRLSFAR